jgi:hypothetical protein
LSTVPSHHNCAKKRYLPESDLSSCKSHLYSIWRGFKGFPYAHLLLSTLLLTSCVEESETVSQLDVTESDPLATDSFVMRNAEIREDLLEQLDIHGIEYWINGNGSIGFYVRDTKAVDRLANEAIGVYISLQ